ncbi:hypothetical protein OO009_09825 [Flavobacteriaceae bacterium KMM 6897]|nr:hypothetical protein [Flavobacteriaceae bacterium KMM 6897]MEB8344604.1 hypothetical protein [Flavobacteriaceae bacterium KMM 6898]
MALNIGYRYLGQLIDTGLSVHITSYGFLGDCTRNSFDEEDLSNYIILLLSPKSYQKAIAALINIHHLR